MALAAGSAPDGARNGGKAAFLIIPAVPRAEQCFDFPH
jgi:hypothetical protein